MKHLISIAAAAALLVYGHAGAGPIADTFGPGLFGVTWDGTKEQVQGFNPGGKWHHEPVDSYQVADSREIFGIARKKQKITFAFTADGRLSSVGIYFGGGIDGYAKVLHFMTEQFGPPLQNTNEKIEENYGFGATVGARWPIDGRIHVTLLAQITGFSTTTLLIVQHSAEQPLDRGVLGLE